MEDKAKTILTGVKPTGATHIGNYVGAIRPAVELSKKAERSLLFIADYHALISVQKAEELKQQTYDVAATWLAAGIDPEKVIFYRQSDIPEVFELAWILSCVTAKGLMNRAHAYKARVAENAKEAGKDPDYGVSMGLYNYPILMCADIVMFDADQVPVGEDQVQHLEIARDITQRFNHIFKTEALKLPKALVQKDCPVIPGLDGRKMSASYGNTIPLFLEPKKLRKLINKITTDSSAPEEPKDPDKSPIFLIYKQFATTEEIQTLKDKYQSGIAWGEAKQSLFEVIDRELTEPREKYNALLADTAKLDKLLENGAKKAREVSSAVMKRVRAAIGS